ncbi:MAG: DUF58 domain-containing protein [Gemmatimonadota bacterium]
MRARHDVGGTMKAGVAFDYGRLLESLRGVSWPAARRVAGTRPGAHGSKLRGRAPELSEYRAYRQGDDPRDLDWKLLARSDRAFVRLSEDRAVHPTWLILDASRSMAWPVETHRKWQALCGMAVGLAAIARQAGDPVGAVVDGESDPVVSGLSSRADVTDRLIGLLDQVRFGTSDGMVAAWRGLPVGGREVLMSDLLGDEAGWRALAAARIAAGSEVIVVHIVSNAELEPPPSLSMVVDPDVASVARILDETGRAAYRSTFADWQQTVRNVWIAAGARFNRVVADDDPAVAVRSIVQREAR